MDVAGHEASGLAYHGTYIHLIALGHGGGSRSANVLSHGQNDLRRQRHHYRFKVGSPFFMRDSRTLRGTFEKFTHSDFDLPILQSLELWSLDTHFIRSPSSLLTGTGNHWGTPPLYHTHAPRRPSSADARQNPPDPVSPVKQVRRFCLRALSYTFYGKIARLISKKTTCFPSILPPLPKDFTPPAFPSLP